ncbi:alcohol dehydrogenase catalytic domain-containing protein [Cellulosimicrobium composti]|nr:alcohol dehydrogenase catalytic domain-containing protein [Cellulosimicrobium composti]
MTDTSADLMKAASFARFGAPDVLDVVERPRPRAGAGEVVVRVDATTVNGGEIAQRRGKLQWIVRTALPAYPGVDLAGEIVETGPGVTTFRLGELVWGTVDERGPDGTAAERCSHQDG